MEDFELSTISKASSIQNDNKLTKYVNLEVDWFPLLYFFLNLNTTGTQSNLEVELCIRTLYYA